MGTARDARSHENEKGKRKEGMFFHVDEFMVLFGVN